MQFGVYDADGYKMDIVKTPINFIEIYTVTKRAVFQWSKSSLHWNRTIIDYDANVYRILSFISSHNMEFLNLIQNTIGGLFLNWTRYCKPLAEDQPRIEFCQKRGILHRIKLSIHYCFKSPWFTFKSSLWKRTP